jgi:uncharacterized membrane protein YkoI
MFSPRTNLTRRHGHSNMSFHSVSVAIRVAAVLSVVGLSAQPVHAQRARATPQQTMAQEARVSKDAARITALGKVPGGRMSSIELRRGPAGKLLYTALITETGKPQKTEVVIDAMTGAVVSKRP